MDILQNTRPAGLKTVKVIKNKERRELFQEEPKGHAG